MTGETREAVERLDADVPVAYEPDSADDGRYDKTDCCSNDCSSYYDNYHRSSY